MMTMTMIMTNITSILKDVMKCNLNPGLEPMD